MWHLHACKCHCVFSGFTWVQTQCFLRDYSSAGHSCAWPSHQENYPCDEPQLMHQDRDPIYYLTFIQIPAGSGHKYIIGKNLFYIFPTYTFKWETTENYRANMSLARWLWWGKWTRVQTYKGIISQLATTLSIWRWSACNFSSHKSLWGEWLWWDLLHLCTMRLKKQHLMCYWNIPHHDI